MDKNYLTTIINKKAISIDFFIFLLDEILTTCIYKMKFDADNKIKVQR